MKNTKIEWCDHTFNPWIGCTMISEGCVHCYASAIEKRFGRDPYDKDRDRVRTSADYWKQPERWSEQAYRDHVRRRVFVGSMCDVFDEQVPRFWFDDLMTLVSRCRGLDWLFLTKRILNSPDYFKASHWGNVWLGVSVENQKRARERIPMLRRIPGVGRRFLSVEPLLGPVQLDAYNDEGPHAIDWVIVGGESGPNARPMEIEWVQDIKRQCIWNGWRLFVKQLGGHPDKRHALEDFPEDLRIREFPSKR